MPIVAQISGSQCWGTFRSDDSGCVCCPARCGSMITLQHVLSGGELYAGTLSALVTIAQKEGVGALYRPRSPMRPFHCPLSDESGIQ